MLDQFSVSISSTIPSAERGGVLDILPRLFEDRPEHPGLLAQFIENLAVVSFEFFAVALQQAGPIESCHSRLSHTWRSLMSGAGSPVSTNEKFLS